MRYLRPRLQRLEDRLAPANLAIVSAVLMDNAFPPAPQPTPVIGQRVYVRANWTTSGLSAADSYIVRIAVDGIALETGAYTGAVGNGIPYSVTLDGWYASPGSHNVVVSLDPLLTVGETDETDNTTTIAFATGPVAGLAEKLISPIYGTQNQTWGIGNYIDVDPRPGSQVDYRGGPFVYDGHDGLDAGPVLFDSMDRGTPVYTAAGGTVSLIGDTNAFDRWTTTDFSQSRPVNWVIVDHGNGWSTFYDHLATNSITVAVGDTVRAGDLVGLMGSSGNSAGIHLHFALMYRGSVVETGYDLANYWHAPPAYPTDVAATILDAGVTNLSLFDDTSRERLPDINTFSTTTNDDVFFWFFPNRFKAGEPVTVTYYRPNGTSFSNGYTPTESAPTGVFNNWYIDRSIWGSVPGAWQVAVSMGGVELLRKNFTVTTGAGVPSIRLSGAGDALLADGRTTPVNLGSAPLNGAPATFAFTIRNHGSATLNLTGLQLPVGFGLQGTFPGSVAGNASATFTVQMNTTTAGPQFGELRFGTNDPDTPLFNFNLSGMVTGAPPAGTPAIVTALPATAFYHGRGDELLNPTATLTDSNSPNFDGGQLRVEIASGGDANDYLGLRSQGFGPGEIAIGDVTIWYSGVPTAMYATGSSQSTIVLNLIDGATTEAVQALIRNLTYTNTAATPQTHRRYVRITLTDDTGLVSNRAIVDVIHAGKLSPAPHVALVRVNDGSAQRSRVTDLTVTFDAAVTFDGPVGNAFTLTRTGGGAVSFAATANVVNGVTVVTLNNFTGMETQFGSLRDGRYTLTMLASEITAGGVQLNNGVDSSFGDNQGLYRFYGDMNGDRRVDISDFGFFSRSYLTPPNYNAALDFNNDGRIDIADFGQFSVRFFTTLP